MIMYSEHLVDELIDVAVPSMPLVQTGAGASSPPRQPRQLPWLIFETIINYKKWPKQLGRFEEKNIFIFLPCKKLLKYTVSFLQN